MNPKRRAQLAREFYFAYCDAENHIEAMKIKDAAYDLGIMIGESYIETLELNRLKLIA